MKEALLCVALVCSMLVAGVTPAAAQTSSPKVGVAVKLGVLGAGVDVAVPVGDKVNIRGGFSGFSLSHEFEDDGITLDATLKLRSASAHLDWFPFGGGFHLSPGVMLYNGNEMNAVARVPGGTRFSLGDLDVISNPASPVTGTADVVFTRVAPSLMMGWGNVVPRTKSWSIPFELGVVFSQAPTGTLHLTGSACDQGGNNCRSIATDATLQAEVRKQEAELNDNIDVLKFIPVFSIGVAFSF